MIREKLCCINLFLLLDREANWQHIDYRGYASEVVRPDTQNNHKWHQDVRK